MYKNFLSKRKYSSKFLFSRCSELPFAENALQEGEKCDEGH